MKSFLIKWLIVSIVAIVIATITGGQGFKPLVIVGAFGGALVGWLIRFICGTLMGGKILGIADFLASFCLPLLCAYGGAAGMLSL